MYVKGKLVHKIQSRRKGDTLSVWLMGKSTSGHLYPLATIEGVSKKPSLLVLGLIESGVVTEVRPE